MTTSEQVALPGAPAHDIPVDWEALEDAFENNAPEVHSYLHLGTGDVLRVIDGIADPQMHVRIAADSNYLRIDPVSSREQYRWMERYIPMVEEAELTAKLTQAIDGKGAFRRFKDVLMSYGPERERWFAFRSERLRTFMEAWLSAHGLNPVARPAWPAETTNGEPTAPGQLPGLTGPTTATTAAEEGAREAREARRPRSAEALRKALRDITDTLPPRDLDALLAFAEFLKVRRTLRPLPSGAGAEGHVESGTDTSGRDDEPPASHESPRLDVQAQAG